MSKVSRDVKKELKVAGLALIALVLVVNFMPQAVALLMTLGIIGPITIGSVTLGASAFTTLAEVSASMAGGAWVGSQSAQTFHITWLAVGLGVAALALGILTLGFG